MQVTVSYATQLRTLTGLEEEAFEPAEHASLASLLSQVCARHDPKVRELLLDENGAIRSPLFVCLNDTHILDPASCNLSDGDQVLIMSAISGG